MQSVTSSLRSLALAPSSTRASVVRTLATAASSSSASTPSQWTPSTKRTGVLARKHGMTCLWHEDGTRIPVTVLEAHIYHAGRETRGQRDSSRTNYRSFLSFPQLDAVQVLSSQSFPATDKAPARHTVVVGCSARKAKTTSGPLLGQFRKAGIEPKMRVAEFEVTHDALVPIGTTISAAHFVPGQHVDVQAPSIGKGFQGVMKRHGFGGLRASHGVSVSHRSHGSTGQHQDPGRVFPGKKMAGRMGGLNVTTQNLVVECIDTALNVVYVRGAVPGAPGAFVRVSDALKKVGWKAQARAQRGLDREKGEVLEGVKGFPMPAATVEMAQEWPREVQRAGGAK
ncbi:hypothetical protein JCM11641_002735 [Rhodosporidiobolus odoratus]